MILFARSAISNAVNAGHDKVSAEDVLRAEATYSQFAFEALVVENALRAPNIESLLFSFIGGPSEFSEAGLPSEFSSGEIVGGTDEAIRLLVGISFLGYVLSDGRPMFARDAADVARVTAIAARQTSETLRYVIHPAYRAYLETTETNP